MDGDRLDLTDIGKGLFIHVLLTEAAKEIDQEEDLNKVVEDPQPEQVWHSERCIEGISKDVVAGDDKHHNVESALPRAILLNQQLVEESEVLVAGVVLFDLVQLVAQFVVHHQVGVRWCVEQLLLVRSQALRLRQALGDIALRVYALEPLLLFGEQVLSEELVLHSEDLFLFLANVSLAAAPAH